VTPEGTGNAEDVPATESLLPIAIKLEVFSDMETDPSPETLPVAEETHDCSSSAEAPPVIEPGLPIPAAEGVGGAALSLEEDDAPTQRSVARLCGTHTHSL